MNALSCGLSVLALVVPISHLPAAAPEAGIPHVAVTHEVTMTQTGAKINRLPPLPGISLFASTGKEKPREAGLWPAGQAGLAFVRKEKPMQLPFAAAAGSALAQPVSPKIIVGRTAYPAHVNLLRPIYLQVRGPAEVARQERELLAHPDAARLAEEVAQSFKLASGSKQKKDRGLKPPAW